MKQTRQLVIGVPPRIAAMLVVLGIGLMIIISHLFAKPTISLQEFGDLVRAQHVQHLTIRGDQILAALDTGSTVIVYRDPQMRVDELLRTLAIPDVVYHSLPIEFAPNQFDRLWYDLLINGLPIILIAMMFVNVIMRVSAPRSRNATADQIDKRALTVVPITTRCTTFSDVAGAQEAKEQLQDVIAFLKDPARFRRLGAHMPRGVLLIGPPGTGKTMLARAVAGEANVPFFAHNGSEFVEIYAGIGASRVRDLFAQARRQTPSIIFIDEVDSVARSRGTGVGNSSDEREQTLNQILTELDGFTERNDVIVMAATNRLDILDPALLRPGRFDRHVYVDLPDLADRTRILAHYLVDKPVSPDIQIEVLAKQMPGCSGADLANVINEAAILTARRNGDHIGEGELQESIERVILGVARINRFRTDREKQIIAYHEAGHAIIAVAFRGYQTVQKISLLSRGKSLGYTLILPQNETLLRDRQSYQEEMAMLLGGRAAEALIFDTVTTSGREDLDRATKLAHSMVTLYGMSEVIGPLHLGRQSPYYNGVYRAPSTKIAHKMDEEVARFLREAELIASETLLRYRPQLERVAQALLVHETLSERELADLISDMDPLGPGETIKGVQPRFA